jgi:hypothetical protein
MDPAASAPAAADVGVWIRRAGEPSFALAPDLVGIVVGAAATRLAREWGCAADEIELFAVPHADADEGPTDAEVLAAMSGARLGIRRPLQDGSFVVAKISRPAGAWPAVVAISGVACGAE